ncbi:MAG: YfiR family protein [Bryobacteraceae bacterium]
MRAAFQFLLLLPLQLALYAADAQSLEYQVKAAFLLNFTKFVDWPPGSFGDGSSPVSICILGPDSFGSAIDRIVVGEVVNSRKVVIQRLKDLPPPKPCQVLFARKSEKDMPRLLSELGPGVLTVGESDSFLSDGGMINFVVDNRRVHFDINQAAAEKAGIKLSARLLSVARAVKNQTVEP